MPPAIDDITQQKLNKLIALREAGIEPFPYGYHRTHTALEAIDLLDRSLFTRDNIFVTIKSLDKIHEFLDFNSNQFVNNNNKIKDNFDKTISIVRSFKDLENSFFGSSQSNIKKSDDTVNSISEINIFNELSKLKNENLEMQSDNERNFLIQLARIFFTVVSVQTYLIEKKLNNDSPDQISSHLADFLGSIFNYRLFEQEKSILTVNVAGRVLSKRGMGKTAFMDLRDGSGKIQLFFRINNLGDKYNLVKDIDIGDILGASGKLFLTRTSEPTVEVQDFILLAKALQPLPEKWHGLVDVEKRYRQRYLDLISNPDTKKTFDIRCKTISAIRNFLDKRSFTEVETPVLQPEAGGASARPFITHYNALDRDFYLRIALELHLKRLIIGGFDKVYEIGHVFRNEGIDFKHIPEFTMLETYEAYVDYLDVMKMVEEMISTVCQQVLGTMKIEYNGRSIDLTPPWQRLEMHQAVLQYAELDYDQYPDTASLKAEMMRRGMQFDASKERGKLIDELVSTYVDPQLIQPTFLFDYPIEMSPLAKKKPGNAKLVERFEPYVAGMEIGNAFTELNDPLDQRQRFLKQMEERARGDEEAQQLDEDFLLAMEHGMPPTGGLGIGIDRVVMLFTNHTSIRDVILFPALKEK